MSGSNNDNREVYNIPIPEEESFGKKFRRKFKSDPFVPIGCAVTAGILFSGLGNFTRQASRANSVRSQKLMRARVIAQGITMAFLAYGTFLASWEAKDREADIASGKIESMYITVDKYWIFFLATSC